MDHKSQFLSSQIIDLLKNRIGDYVLFYYGYVGVPDFRQGESPVILLPQNKLELFLSGLQDLPGNIQVQVTEGGNGVDIELNDASGTQVKVQCVHRLLHKSLCILDEDEVNVKRVRHAEGFYIPSIEHLFEYVVLQSWIEYKGISDRFVRFFEELHVLVQEDLLDYFNQKYKTHFLSIDDLSEFKISQRGMIIKSLERNPANGFMQNVRMRLFGSSPPPAF
jgi:hypothetical protein